MPSPRSLPVHQVIILPRYSPVLVQSGAECLSWFPVLYHYSLLRMELCPGFQLTWFGWTSPLLRDWIVAQLPSHSLLQLPRLCLEERSWRGLTVSRSSLSSPCLAFIYYWGDDNDLVNGWKNALSLFSFFSSIVYSLPLQSAFLRLILTNSLHLSVAKVLSLLEVLRLRFLLGAHLSDQASHT